jgi:uncharacterized protein (TIRG00374 family)
MLDPEHPTANVEVVAGGQKSPSRGRELAGKVLRIVVSIGLIALVVWAVDWKKTLRVLSHVHIGWAIGAGLMSLVDRAVLNVKWQVLLEALKVRMSYMQLLKIQFASNVVGTFFPSSLGVDAFRTYGVIRHGFSKTSVIAATLIDRLTIIAAMLSVGAIMLVVNSTLAFPSIVTQMVFGLGAAGIAIAAVLAIPSVRKPLARTIARIVPAKIMSILQEVWDQSIGSLLTWHVLQSTIVTLIGAILARIGVGYMLARACGVDPTFDQVLIAYPIVWIAVMLPITVGGLGLQEAAYIVAMGVIGIPAEVAVAMSILEHLVLRIALLPGLPFLQTIGFDLRNRGSQLTENDVRR